jgi:hypothetical protein
MSTRRRRTTTPGLGRALLTLATLATLAAASALSACSDATPAAPSSSVDVVAGTYVLEQVNAHALPLVLGTERWESMMVTLAADRTLRVVLDWRQLDEGGTTAGRGTERFSGRYSVQGSRLTLVVDDDEPATAVLDGARLTLTADGNVMAFRRR